MPANTIAVMMPVRCLSQAECFYTGLRNAVFTLWLIRYKLIVSERPDKKDCPSSLVPLVGKGRAVLSTDFLSNIVWA